MGMNNKVLGLIFASINDTNVIDLTKLRTMGSIPFGGRYRLIDFPLSNMVNSGISEVGVITKSNYGSLLDHLGSGREWDLTGKTGGLHLLPPFSHVGGGIYQGRLEALNNVREFVEHSKSEYVVLSNCDVVTNIDFNAALQQHIDTEADITIIYSKGFYSKEKNPSTNVISVDENHTVKEVLITPAINGECNVSLEMFIMRTEFLKKIVQEAASKSQHSLVRDVLQGRKDEFVIKGYEHKGVFTKIDGLAAYYQANLSLLQADTRAGENCVLFRGVRIGKDAVVKNSVLMQGTHVGEKCNIERVIADKNVDISSDKVLTGSDDFPLYLSKNGKI